MKRECSISNKNLKSKLSFVKLIQGLANAHLAEERFIIIGADQKERKFFPVNNADEFDAAKLSATLAKYLNPLPSFEAFNALTEKDGSGFVLIVLAASQPRPIVIKADAEADDGSAHIRTGEILIKENTGLRPAIREDLEAMYGGRIEAEAESRSRAR
jgi:predicted HTH transcriptional regulator